MYIVLAHVIIQVHATSLRSLGEACRPQDHGLEAANWRHGLREWLHREKGVSSPLAPPPPCSGPIFRGRYGCSQPDPLPTPIGIPCCNINPIDRGGEGGHQGATMSEGLKDEIVVGSDKPTPWSKLIQKGSCRDHMGSL